MIFYPCQATIDAKGKMEPALCSDILGLCGDQGNGRHRIADPESCGWFSRNFGYSKRVFVMLQDAGVGSALQ
jgi:hypothetical protein